MAEELAEMARKAALLSDEREALMAQLLSTSHRPRTSSRIEPAPLESGQENQGINVPPATTTAGVVAERALQLLKESNRSSSDGVRNVSSVCRASVVVEQSRGMHAVRSQLDSIAEAGDGCNAEQGGADAAGLPAAVLVLQNDRLKALVQTRDRELAGVREQLRASEERAAKIFGELRQAKQAFVGENASRELLQYKTMLHGINSEFRELQVDRDRSEASLLDQLGATEKKLSLNQQELEEIKNQCASAKAAADQLQLETETLRKDLAARDASNDSLLGQLQTLWRLASRGASTLPVIPGCSLTRAPAAAADFAGVDECVSEAAEPPTSTRVVKEDCDALSGASIAESAEDASWPKSLCKNSGERGPDASKIPAVLSSLADGLHQHIMEMMDSIQLRDRQVERTSRDLDEQKSKMDDLIQAHSATQQETQALLEERDERIARLLQDMKNAQDGLESGREATARLTERICEMQDTEADLRAQTDALREEVRIKGMECSHLENAVKSVQNELDQARGESEEEQKRIDALEFEKHSLEVSMQQVLEASRRWEDNCNDLMKASSTLEETKSNLNTQLQHLKREHEVMTKSNSELEEQLNHARIEAADKSKSLWQVRDLAEQDLEALRSEHASAKAKWLQELKECNERLDEQSADCQRLRRSAVHTQSELRDAEKLREEKAHLSAEVNRLSTDQKRLQEEASDGAHRMEQLEAEMKKQAHKLKKSEVDRDTAQEERDQSLARLEILNIEVREAQLMNKRTAAELTEARREASDLLKHREVLEGDVARLTQLVEEVSWDLKHAESAVRDLVTRNSELESTCEELEHRLQEKEKEEQEMIASASSRLRDAAFESSCAQSGLNALTDEHKILQQELCGLEQALMDKESEMQCLRQQLEENQDAKTASRGHLLEISRLRMQLQRAEAREREREISEPMQGGGKEHSEADRLRGQLNEMEARHAETMLKKEMQMIEFLTAVEDKTRNKEEELSETKHRLARAEDALHKLMVQCGDVCDLPI